jgi:hypothetical protein
MNSGEERILEILVPIARLQNFCFHVLVSYNIKMDPRDIGWDCVDWIDMAQDKD